MQSNTHVSPIIIGGIGGSGTRIIAEILLALDVYLGDFLNESNDNLWFTYFFRRPSILQASEHEFAQCVTLFSSFMTTSNEFTEQEKAYIQSICLNTEQSKLILHHLSTHKPTPNNSNLWGWKEPNSHVVLNRLQHLMPNLKYIHVIRNGLDMAFSKNQKQLKMWGSHYLERPVLVNPHDSLKYWLEANKRAISFGNTQLQDNFLLLNFDQLCLNPKVEIKRLLSFLELTPTSAKVEDLCRLVSQPSSMGRFKIHNAALFDQTDFELVQAMGFDTTFYTNAMFAKWLGLLQYRLSPLQKLARSR